MMITLQIFDILDSIKHRSSHPGGLKVQGVFSRGNMAVWREQKPS